MFFQKVIDEFVLSVKETIKGQLTGIYLHGSLAMGCFNPEKSDIDLIVVIEDNISDQQKMILMQQIAALNQKAPAKGLEVSVVKREYCAPFVYPTPFELHFSPMHLQWFYDNPSDYVAKMKGEDKDLAAHFTIINKFGMVLYGEEIKNVFADVPRENYIDSICCDVENALADILEQPVYVILNLCRVLAFLQNGLYLSKKDGGKWGINYLPPEYHSLISNAMECYAANDNMAVNREHAVSFAARMLQLIREIQSCEVLI